MIYSRISVHAWETKQRNLDNRAVPIIDVL